jgi:SPFH domain / Band 7 family
MRVAIDYIVKNKEWIFSGIGVFGISAVLWICRLFFQPWRRKRAENTSKSELSHKKTSGPTDIDGIPQEWQGVSPTQSKYKFVTEKRDSVPLGLQSFSFEYAFDGHAAPLTLKNMTVRAEIGFTCKITNPYKALFASNDYALNILPPRFLTEARALLEANSLSNLRARRSEVSHEILSALNPQFEKLGVQLESVTIGALERVDRS